jgi:hypothetical protein
MPPCRVASQQFQLPFEENPAKGKACRLSPLVNELVLPDHSSAHGVGHSAFGSALGAAGNNHANSRIVTHMGVDHAQRFDQCPIFSRRHARHAANPAKHGCSHSKAGA